MPYCACSAILCKGAPQSRKGIEGLTIFVKKAADAHALSEHFLDSLDLVQAQNCIQSGSGRLTQAPSHCPERRYALSTASPDWPHRAADSATLGQWAASARTSSNALHGHNLVRQTDVIGAFLQGHAHGAHTSTSIIHALDELTAPRPEVHSSKEVSLSHAEAALGYESTTARQDEEGRFESMHACMHACTEEHATACIQRLPLQALFNREGHINHLTSSFVLKVSNRDFSTVRRLLSRFRVDWKVAAAFRLL